MPQVTFDDGVLWAAARLVEFHDVPTLARELIEQSGADIAQANECDAPFIAKAFVFGKSAINPQPREGKICTTNPHGRKN